MSQNGPVIRRSSPQIAQVSSISSTMLDVIVALLPALGMAVYLFGPRVLALTLVSVAACMGAEYGYRRLMGLSNTVGDLSACVTGLLLAMSLPVTAPYWAPVLGGVFAIVVVKQFYGGLGRNFMNPALAGRALLCTFPGLMTTWVDAFQKTPLFGAVDAVSSPTPMALLHAGELPGLTLSQLMLGQHGGAMGGAPVFMLLLGGVYLVGRRVISPRIPLSYLGTVALLTLLFPRGDGGALAWMTAQLCSGGLVLGAVFMASDYTTTPVTPVGQTLFGVGCGLLTVLLRYFGSYPDGVGWAILTMNCCVWLLDRAALPRRFGVGRFEAVRGWVAHLRTSAAAIHFVPPKVKFLARAGDGTMPGEGYLDELRGSVRQLAALAVVFAVTCGVVFGVHQATDYAAVRAETAVQQTLLAQVMPQATVRSETPYRAPGALSITAGYNDSGLVGYCVEVQANGFGGVLTAVVGVNTNGEVTGVAVTDHRETVGVGTQALESGYLSQYTGRSGTIRTSGSNRHIRGGHILCEPGPGHCGQPGYGGKSGLCGWRGLTWINRKEAAGYDGSSAGRDRFGGPAVRKLYFSQLSGNWVPDPGVPGSLGRLAHRIQPDGGDGSDRTGSLGGEPAVEALCPELFPNAGLRPDRSSGGGRPAVFSADLHPGAVPADG